MYEINDSTVAIVATTELESLVYEENSKFIVKESVNNIINNSCRYFGSSYIGRLSGTKKILGISYKAPIIVEESSDIVFFPTASPRLKTCSWLSLKKIIDYKKEGSGTKVFCINNIKIEVEMSYNSFDNQILRAARLQMLVKNRKIRNNY